MTIFYVSFLAAELPSQLSKYSRATFSPLARSLYQSRFIVSKKLGSDVWIPIQMMSWSLVAMAQFALKNKTGFFVTRALLGLIEGGFIADTILYLSYYYSELNMPLLTDQY